MREQQNRPSPEHGAEDLNRRLDQLSRDELDRVLERAIREHAEKRDGGVFTADHVGRIASELGLDPEVVDRALREELSTPDIEVHSEHWFPLGPGRIRGRATVTGPVGEVTERVQAWMESEEGLRPTSRTAGGVRWVKDTHWVTGARLALGTDATKAIRGMREAVHRVRPITADRHRVEIEVDTERIRLVSGWVGAGISALGVASAVGVATSVPGGFDLGQWATVAVPGVLAGSTAALVIARTWTRSVTEGVRRALDGISHPDLYRRASRRMERRSRGRRSTLQRLVDDVSDAIDRLGR